MPRLTTRIILEARKYDSCLPLLLRECRSLDSAKNELRWLRERALCIVEQRRIETSHGIIGWRGILKSMCQARSKGMPLQYILGDQPFGDLDIECKKDVLIPRHETEAITYHAARLISERIPLENRRETPLKVLDLCTGTGCISLLLHALLAPRYPRLSIVGLDISNAAIELARENTNRNVRLGTLSRRALKEVTFHRGNVLEYGTGGLSALIDILGCTSVAPAPFSPYCDVLISNPPYVSHREYYDGTTSRSVRVYEPRLALVPPDNSLLPMVAPGYLRHEDSFYYHIASLALVLRVRLAVMECGSRSQALRVAALCREIFHKQNAVESAHVDIWPVTGVMTDPCAVLVQC